MAQKDIETRLHSDGAARGVEGLFMALLDQHGIHFGRDTQAKLTQAALDYASEARAAKAGK